MLLYLAAWLPTTSLDDAQNLAIYTTFSQHVPGFLKRYVCDIVMCMCPPEAINKYSRFVLTKYYG